VAELAGNLVKEGALIIYPTDTLYGLGCDPFNQDAVRRIYEVKGRAGKPLPVLADGLRSALRVARLRGAALELAETYWPGQLTVVVEAEPRVVGPLTAGGRKVGVRVPASIQALEILKESGGLLVGTSANPSGAPAPRSVEELDRGVAEAVELAVDGGPCRVGMPSTVVELEERSLRILRLGAVGVESLRRWAEERGLALHVERGDALKH